MTHRWTAFTLLAAAPIFLVASTALAQHGAHPPMPDQTPVLVATIVGAEGPKSVEARLQVPTAALAADLAQTVTLPAPYPALRLTRYLPMAQLEQEVVPADDGVPSVLVSIDGPKQHYRRWMIADDPDRNRLLSLVGTWRYMTVRTDEERNALFEQFRDEFVRPPLLLVGRPDSKGWVRVEAEPGRTFDLEEIGAKVRILEFYPHFGIDTESRPSNLSDQRVNPAALVEMEYGGKKGTRWVFAKFGAFSSHEKPDLPLPARLDCPPEKKGTSPDFVIVGVGDSRHEVWTRHGESTSSAPLTQDEAVKVAGSAYEFKVVRFEPRGVLREKYVPVEGRRGIPAACVEVVGEGGGGESCWIELNKERALATPQGSVSLLLRFEARAAAPGQGGDR